MFTILFAALIEFSVWGMALYVGYRIVFYKSIREKKDLKIKKENAEKMALVLLKSPSNKDVQLFMKENVSFLSQKTFEKLNEHLDYLNVLSDEPLKARFEELEPSFEDGLVSPEIVEEKESYRNKA